VNARRTVTTDPLMTPAAVAAAFRVDPKTVARWAKAGKLSSIRTLGGNRRYLESEVRAILAAAACGQEWHEPAAAGGSRESSSEPQPAVGFGSGSAAS
jgi:hypothetical protein